jgi:hypothetical protein
MFDNRQRLSICFFWLMKSKLVGMYESVSVTVPSQRKVSAKNSKRHTNLVLQLWIG